MTRGRAHRRRGPGSVTPGCAPRWEQEPGRQGCGGPCMSRSREAGKRRWGRRRGGEGRGEDEEEEKKERRRGGGPELPRPAEPRERQDRQPPQHALPAPPTPSAGTWGCRCARIGRSFRGPSSRGNLEPKRSRSRGSTPAAAGAEAGSCGRSVGCGSCEEASCSLAASPLRICYYLFRWGGGAVKLSLRSTFSPPPIYTLYLPLKAKGFGEGGAVDQSGTTVAARRSHG